jgi:hypothetical protein
MGERRVAYHRARMPPRARLALLLLLAVHAAWAGLYVARTSFEADGRRVFCLWDDAMISMTYARNLREGHGLVWNAGGEAVQGFSNLGVTLAMAALHALPLAPERTSLAFQTLCLLLQTATLAWVARLAGRDDPWLGVAAAIFAALSAPLCIWSLQGSDAAPLALWLVACTAVLARAVPPPALCAALALGALLRPDAGLFFAAALAARASCAPRAWTSLCAGAVALAFAAGGYLLFGWLAYGDPLPNTWYLKATGMPRRLVLERGLASLALWLPGALGALAAGAYALRRMPRDPLLRIAASLVAVSALYELSVGGDWIVRHGSRFVAPALPLLGLLASRGLGAAISALPRTRACAPGLACAGCALLALAASPLAATREWLDPRAPTLLRDHNRANWQLGATLRDHTAPSTRVAVHWAGVIPYVSRRYAIDVLGKSDRHIARLSVDRFEPGHAKWDWDYVLETLRPDVFDAPSRGLERDARFLASFVRVRAPGGARFYLRRDAAGLLRGIAPDSGLTGNP